MDVTGEPGVEENVEVIFSGMENLDEYSERSWISCIERRGSLPVERSK